MRSKKRNLASIIIQKFGRGWIVRTRLKQYYQILATKEQSAILIQKQLRGMIARKYVKKKQHDILLQLTLLFIAL